MVSITEKAATELKSILEKEGKLGYGLRIFIAGIGCSGPNYGLALDDKSKEGDIVIESNDINLFMDKQLEFYLDGAEIDYVKTAQGAGFIIKNLHVGPTCSSCGSSCDSH